MSDLITWLLDYEPFVPRYKCGPGWTDGLVATHQMSELLIFIAYMLIPPLAWIRFQQGYFNRPLAHLRVFLCWMALFVATCGATHLMGRLMFVFPMYRLDALVLMSCVVASYMTIWTLIAMEKPKP